MHRRDLLKGFAAAGALAAFGRGSQAAPAGWRRFEITYQIDLATDQKPTLLWVPVPQDALDYQRVIDLNVALAGRRVCSLGGGFARPDGCGFMA